MAEADEKSVEGLVRRQHEHQVYTAPPALVPDKEADKVAAVLVVDGEKEEEVAGGEVQCSLCEEGRK